MICILVFARVLYRQGETSQGTSEEKKKGMIFDITWHGWNQKWCSTSGVSLLRILEYCPFKDPAQISPH